MFDNLKKKINDRDKKLIAEAEEECNKLHSRLLSLERIQSLFPEKLFVRNHMYCIKIKLESLDGTSLPNVIDLKELSEHTENAFYSKKKTPSMVLFADNVYCCAILTKKGNINLVGGYTENEIKYTLIKFLTMIQDSYQISYKNSELIINSLELHNMAVSTSIPLAKIDIYNATSLLEYYEIPFKYTPENHDLLTITPFPKTFPSVNIRIFPSGGIFSYGFKSFTEINLIMGVFGSLITDFIRKQPCNQNLLNEWRLINLNNWKNQELNKIKRRTKKIKNWNKLRDGTDENINNL